MNKKYIFQMLSMLALSIMATSCDEHESYSELLRDEEHAVNWYLAQQRVEASVPADSVLLTGSDAPYYKLDEDGYIYMQVIEAGDVEDKPEVGDKVYFRYTRKNIKNLYNYGSASDDGNADDLGGTFEGISFVYGNSVLPSTAQWGTGIQKPLEFVGYNSEVNLVLSSYYGFVSDQTSCQPYAINIRYFKPEY